MLQSYDDRQLAIGNLGRGDAMMFPHMYLSVHSLTAGPAGFARVYD